MKKDVIYVDIEDDITVIIDKVKNAQAKIVALVPPKRVGVLQSVVNLKLLKRAAEGANKRVVLITNDSALSSLAAGVAIPVAKNLQSKPEIAPITTLEIDDEDVINGEELPVGELASIAPDSAPLATAATKEPKGPTSVGPAPAAPAAALAASKAPTKKNGISIPNFDRFRKRIFIFGGIGLLLVGFLVWAIFFAGQAVISITARTTPYSVNRQLTLEPNGSLDANEGIVPVTVKQVQKTTSVDFKPTGKKQVGEKATGSVEFSNNTTQSQTVPAGAELSTDGGLVFILDSSVTVPGGAVSCPTIFTCSGTPGSADGSVTAAKPGTDYNGASGDLSGTPSGISAEMDGSTSGGTDKTVTVVSSDDIEKAKEELADQDSDAVKEELKKEFDESFIVIEESFEIEAKDPVSSPKVDQEATSARLTAETTYTLTGIKRDDLTTLLTEDINSQLEGLPNQKIYDNGINDVRFSDYRKGKEPRVRIITTGYVGPNIDSDELAKRLEGKRVGEIQAEVRSVDGVESVDTELSPFWVTTAPSAEKITIKFLIKNEAN